LNRWLAFVFGLLAGFGAMEAKMAPERWGRVTEEERHQLTRAERYFDQKQFKNASAEYELFLQLYGKSDAASYAQLMFAECTRQQGQVNTAMEEFRNVLDYFPDSPDALSAQYSIAVCQRQGGDVEKAVEAFEKVIEQSPKSDLAANSRNELLSIYWRTNKRDKWLTHLEYLATGEYADTDGSHGRSQQRLFMHRLAGNQISEAHALIEQVQKKDPRMTFAEWSVATLRNGEISQSYGEPFAKARPAIATALVALIEKDAAADTARKPDYDLRIARIYSTMGMTDKAVARYQELVNLSAENDGLRLEYAGYLRGIGKREEARLEYRKLKDAYNGDRQIAESYGEENNWKRVLELYIEMLNKYPAQASDLQWRLAEIYQNSGKFPEAITAYQLSQKDPQGLFRIADCQNAMKQHDAAIQTLTSVVNFFKPSAAEAQYRIAACYAAAGNKDAAIRTLKQVCITYLNTPWAGRAHEDLSLKYGVDVTLGGSSIKKDS